MTNVLFVGDVVGRPGRKCLTGCLPEVKKKYSIDLVIVNGENSASGLGISSKALKELIDAGVDVITGGNHIWDNREVFSFIDKEKRLLRPLNHSTHSPGNGAGIFDTGTSKIAVVSVQGRTFMPAVECPFNHALEAVKHLRSITSQVIVDFHAEATSEKVAMGWYLDGMASAVIGTHTHVQTADERILSQNTAYISDVGMTGPYDSVLGVDKGKAVFKFVSGMPVKLKVGSSREVQFNAVAIEVDEKTGKSIKIERIFNTYPT